MTVMTQVDPLHLRPFFELCSEGSGMMRKVARFQKMAERVTMLDVVHLAAMISCSAWTANLIIEQRSGPAQSAAGHMVHSMQASRPAGPSLTISLDEVS
jgi:hypothetical protein